MRARFKKYATAIFILVLLPVILAPIGQFVIQVATDKGYYRNAGERWDGFVVSLTGISGFLASPWVLYPLAILGGFVSGLWVDAMLAKREMRSPPRDAIDPEEIGRRIYRIEFGAKGVAKLETVDPFADLEHVFVNATPYDVAFDRVEGFMVYMNEAPQAPPTVLNPVLIIRSGGQGIIRVRQYFTPQMAAQIANSTVPQERHLATGNFAIWFSYTRDNGAVQMARVAGGNVGYDLVCS